jgi:hypothetical protein
MPTLEARVAAEKLIDEWTESLAQEEQTSPQWKPSRL